jgi:hypothetical protein
MLADLIYEEYKVEEEDLMTLMMNPSITGIKYLLISSDLRSMRPSIPYEDRIGNDGNDGRTFE